MTNHELQLMAEEATEELEREKERAGELYAQNEASNEREKIATKKLAIKEKELEKAVSDNKALKEKIVQLENDLIEQ